MWSLDSHLSTYVSLFWPRHFLSSYIPNEVRVQVSNCVVVCCKSNFVQPIWDGVGCVDVTGGSYLCLHWLVCLLFHAL